jgi:hypothetical protein
VNHPGSCISPKLGRMARCRAGSTTRPGAKAVGPVKDHVRVGTTSRRGGHQDHLCKHAPRRPGPAAPLPAGDGLTKAVLSLGKQSGTLNQDQLSCAGLPRGAPGANLASSTSGREEQRCSRGTAWPGYARSSGCHTNPNTRDQRLGRRRAVRRREVMRNLEKYRERSS